MTTPVEGIPGELTANLADAGRSATTLRTLSEDSAGILLIRSISAYMVG